MTKKNQNNVNVEITYESQMSNRFSSLQGSHYYLMNDGSYIPVKYGDNYPFQTQKPQYEDDELWSFEDGSNNNDDDDDNDNNEMSDHVCDDDNKNKDNEMDKYDNALMFFTKNITPQTTTPTSVTSAKTATIGSITPFTIATKSDSVRSI